MEKIFKTPTRICGKCGVEQSAEKFAPTGRVCFTCKMTPPNLRANNNKRVTPEREIRWKQDNWKAHLEYQAEYRSKMKAEYDKSR